MRNQLADLAMAGIVVGAPRLVDRAPEGGFVVGTLPVGNQRQQSAHDRQ